MEIPELLRTPVERPESLRRGEPPGGNLSDDDTADTVRGWAIAMNFVYGVIGGALVGWAVQEWLWPAAKPWPLLAFLMAGLIGGFARFIREAMKANNAPPSRRPPRQPGP